MLTLQNHNLLDHHQTFIHSSEAILSDTIDLLARIWLDIWTEYEKN